MSVLQQDRCSTADYDVMHFEALGPEAEHLGEATIEAVKNGALPRNHKYFITSRNVQEHLKNNPETRFPNLITIKTHSILPEMYLAGNKKSVITRSAGHDHLEHLAANVNITSLREYCVNAVAQTALKFLYAAAGELNHYTNNMPSFERKASRAFLELGPHKILTVYGVGKIGKRIYEMAEANGLSTQGVDLRQDFLKRLYGGKVKFVSKEEAIISSDIIVNAMNLTKSRGSAFYNVGYFSTEYFSRAKKKLIFINLTRGEIAPESELLDLYLSEKIIGLGLDVFSSESEFAALVGCDKDSGDDHEAARRMVRASLDRSANIYVQPHQGFNSDIAAKTKAYETIKHIVSWYRNRGNCFDEQLPYY